MLSPDFSPDFELVCCHHSRCIFRWLSLKRNNQGLSCDIAFCLMGYETLQQLLMKHTTTEQ